MLAALHSVNESSHRKNLAAVSFTHLARTLGMFCGILNQTHVANSHTAFGQLFWFSGKCVFVQKVLKRIIQNTPRKCPVFGHVRVAFPTHSRSVWDTTHSRNFLCVVHLNFRKSLTEIPRNGCGTMRAAAVTWQSPISPDGRLAELACTGSP